MAKKVEKQQVAETHKRRLGGVVVSNKMTNTIVVKVTTKKLHPIYGKVIKSWKKYKADTAGKTYEIGESVVIEETKNISKMKTWRVLANN